jgi:hypothetical protein
VRLEHLDKPFIFRPVFLQALELMAAGAKCARWRGEQAANRGGAFFTGINQVLSQRADNTVTAGEYLADL